MSSCEICEVEAGTLRCSHVGPLCFECWGSGIHEVMKRKSSELREQLSARLKTCRELLYWKKIESRPVCPTCKVGTYRSLGSRHWRCCACNTEVAS